MGLADARESLSDATWKWRCKLLPHKEKAGRDIEDIEGSLSDDDPKKAPAKDPTFGIDATVKTLYEGKDSCNGYYDWVDYPPKQISKKAAAQAQRPAIMVYKIKDLAKPVVGGRFTLTYHQMTVQNPSLVAALEPILKKEDMHLDVTDTVTFTAPFRPLFFCYEDILDLYKTTGDASLKGYLQILVQTLDSMLGETREKKRRLQASGLINFQLAWTYFPKNTVVYSYTRNAEMLCKVKDTSYEQTPCGMVLLIECQVLAFNGDAFVWVDRTLVIRQFAGNKPIGDLDHYPLQFHRDGPAVQERLLERGKRVLDLQGLVYCSYNGIAVTEKQKHNVQGRILIDVVGYNKHERAQGKREGSDPVTEKNRATVTHPGDPAADPEKQADAKDGSKSQRHLSEARQLQNKEQMLARPDDLVFLSPLIEGYALKNKRWRKYILVILSPNEPCPDMLPSKLLRRRH